MTENESELQEIFDYYEYAPQYIGIRLDSVHVRGSLGDTLLHSAAFAGNNRWVRALLEAGADINASGDLGNTPLHSAALAGHTTVIATLLESGANPNVANEDANLAEDIARLGDKDDAYRMIRQARNNFS